MNLVIRIAVLSISMLCAFEVNAQYYYHHGEKVFIETVTDSTFLTRLQLKQFKTLNRSLDKRFGIQKSGTDMVRLSTNSMAVLTTNIIFKLKPFISQESALNDLKGLVAVQKLKNLDNIYKVKLETKSLALLACQNLYESGLVDYAHPDFILPIQPRSFEPLRDTYFDSQWHLSNSGQTGGVKGVDINVVPAWDETYGEKTQPIIAVIDFGFEQDHPDLKDVWYVNEAEIPGNQIDDDQNGKIDDVRGWNFQTNSANLLDGIDSNHGTAVSGLVASRANGIGVVGVCPMCRILPMTISGVASDDAMAFMYAMEQGADVITNSWGYAIGSPQTELLEEVLKKVANEGRNNKGTTILFAMHNLHLNDCEGSRPDISSHPDVLAISSLDFQGNRIYDSGYGSCLKFLGTSYHPENQSGGLVSTDRQGSNGYNSIPGLGDFEDNNYTLSFGGTSGATPIVAGAFALLYDLKPELTRHQILALFQKSAYKINPREANYQNETGHSDSYGYGLIDVAKAVELALSEQ